MMIACLMTSRIKGYPFEVVVTDEPPGAVLADQIKSLDGRAHRAAFRSKAPAAAIAEVRVRLKALLGL
jgi:mRNA interferase MazF